MAEMQLMIDTCLSVPTDGVHVKCIKGTSKGRIFMGGHDGCLYEIVYQVT